MGEATEKMAHKLEPAEDRPPLAAIIGANVFRLRRYRMQVLSQKALAERAGVDINTVQKIEAGRDASKRQLAIRIDTLEALADALGCEPADLLRYDASTRVYLYGGGLTVLPGSARSFRDEARQAPLLKGISTSPV